MQERLAEMFDSLEAGDEVYHPSKFWRELNAENIQELERSGIENVKRTLAQNYFTWVVGVRSDLFRYLASQTSSRDWIEILRSLPKFDGSVGLRLRRFYENEIFTRMIWQLASRLDRREVLGRLEEPLFGNPFSIRFRKRLISQDLANSVMEMYSITQASEPNFSDSFTTVEVGAGYGRVGYVFMSLFPRSKYVIADIPPALFVSESYLRAVFPDRKIMTFSDDFRWKTHQEAYRDADLVFLLPHQLSELPQKSVDYFVNVSSFHEMTFAQVDRYFELAEYLTRGYVYLKQWSSFDNKKDDIIISRKDYPIRSDWRKIFDRTPPSHPRFFEALFAVA